MSSLEELTSKLTTAFDGKDYQKCDLLLPAIKIELIKNNLLVPTDPDHVNPNDLLVTRSILEVGAIVSINLLNTANFNSFFSQLKLFYGLSQLPTSNNRNKLVALYLLLLLSQGDLASFHIELEQFVNEKMTVDELEQDRFLSVPIKIEKWLIDGDCSKVYEILSQQSTKFPCEEFHLFKNNLIDAVRTEIARNMESTYGSLPIANCKLLLFMQDLTLNDLENFIAERGWALTNGVVQFKPVGQSVPDGLSNEDGEKTIINNVLGYAREMETII
ncbi:unnamed protein product [Kuraishia capsulata CBS 1993]|uniref:CSN8/PSMD8/EIF3K domain-containing protein n=1 Tax=Kuraishia capsulata CBS 1993 TaxID=1382522 RepID=W6MP85_9ASCO|nr:uncharacterized protein KUCA_T00004064001 [Kuraishia capsulata CBS 1993]CDK28083.1 unnamed protein product [Kuraishia capsulata CBS 1993]